VSAGDPDGTGGAGPPGRPPGAPIPAYARSILEGTPIAFMTTMRPDGRMSTNPVSLLFDGAHVRISTVKGRRKLRNLLADDRVTICVVQPDNLNRYVEIRGRAAVEADGDRSFINRMARQYMDADEYPFDRPGDERVIITVIAETVSSPRIPLADDPPYQRRP
jgi:PPOX class probable F420-dependent enzyme